MEGVLLLEASRLIRHASVKMIVRFAHLTPEYLHGTEANPGLSGENLTYSYTISTETPTFFG